MFLLRNINSNIYWGDDRLKHATTSSSLQYFLEIKIKINHQKQIGIDDVISIPKTRYKNHTI